MKYFSSYLCLIILSITMASCDKFFGEELTDLIFDHGKFEMPDKALFIGNSLLLGNGAFGMNATDSAVSCGFMAGMYRIVSSSL